MSITSVRLSADVEQPLDNLVKKLDRSKSYLINQSVKEFIARNAVDESRWEETLEAINAITQGESIDESSVNAWLNSWGTENVKAAPER